MNQKQNRRTFSKRKRRDARTETNEGGFWVLVFFCFAFCVNKDSDETFDRMKEEKQGAAEERN